jgi:hypothetical protein
LKDKIKNHKNFDKKSKGKKKEIRRRRTKLKSILFLSEKKNHKLDLKDKTENHKKLTKKQKKE